MECRQVRITQLKTRNKGLSGLLDGYKENPTKQNQILNEMELNEQIIKFLEGL